MGLNTTPKTWPVVPYVVTGLDLNTEIRDAMNGLQAAWTAYTPSWTSTGTAVALGNGTITGSFRQIGKTVQFKITLTMGSTTTYGTGSYLFSVPVTGLGGANTPMLLSATAFDSSAATRYALGGQPSTTATVILYGYGTANVSAAIPMTWAVGDILTLEGEYEVP